MKSYRKQLETFLKNRFYMFSVVIIAAISFGFSITHLTVDVDSLEGNRYLGSENRMISAGRFGMNFWAKIFGSGYCDPYHAFAIDLIAVILLVAAAIQFCVLFQRVTDNRFSMTGCTIFSCIFISYPLINEIWEYTGANLCVCGGYLLTGLSVYCLNEVITDKEMNKNSRIFNILFSLFCTTIICSSYESIAAVYILCVFAVLFLKSCSHTKETFSGKSLILQGLNYATVLAGGVALRLIIHCALLLLYYIPAGSNGQTLILWGRCSFLKLLFSVTVYNLAKFTYNAFWYFPITLVVICFYSFGLYLIVCAVTKKNRRMLFTGVGMMMSLFALSFLQGAISPYRTCQTYSLFSAFVILNFYNMVKGRKIINAIAVVSAAILCINQATYLSNICTTNYLRSENEANVVRNIGNDLKELGINKSIVFVGQYKIPDSIIRNVSKEIKNKRIYHYLGFNFEDGDVDYRRYVTSNVVSVINWSIVAFDDGKSVEKLFDYYGYIISAESDGKAFEKAEEYVKENNTPSYPENGYIVDIGDYVIVRIGE